MGVRSRNRPRGPDTRRKPVKGKYEIAIKGDGLGTDLQDRLVRKVVEDALAAALANKVFEGAELEINVEGPYDVAPTTAFWTFVPKTNV
jgi:hypothetical protein